METIHRGYEFIFDAHYDDLSDVASVNCRLFSPATGYSVEPVDNDISEDGATKTFVYTAQQTAEMPVGVYNIEVYDGDTLVRYVESYARCVQASPADRKE